MLTMKSVKVDYHEDDRATLTHFTNGILPQSQKQNVHFGFYTNSDETDPNKKARKLLVAETDKMTYVGQNYGTTTSRMEKYCKYYIGVVDKKTGRMRVCDTEVFQMHPRVSGQEEESESLSASLPSNLDLTLMEKNDMLTSAFGSKKKQKAMESRLKNAIKGKALDDAIGSAVSQTDIKQLTQNHHNSQNEHSSLPPFNKDAKEPQDVYRLDSIISSAEMDSLTALAKVLYDSNIEQIKEWKKEEKYPKYIVNHLSLMPQANEERWKRSKCLVYLQYLIHTYRMTAKDWKRKDPLPENWPDAVKKQFLQKFTLVIEGDSNRRPVRCMPARLKDKVLSHILVLCLIIDEFSVEMTDLLFDLKVGYQLLQTHFRAVGCQVKTKKLPLGDGETFEVKLASLVVPLTFPEARQRKKAQRR